MLGACHLLRIADTTGAENKTNIRSLVDTSKREDLLQANEPTLEKAKKEMWRASTNLGESGGVRCVGLNIRLLLRELLDLRFRGRGRSSGGGHFLQNQMRKLDLSARRSIVGCRFRNGSSRRVIKCVVGCRVCRFVKIAVGGRKQEGGLWEASGGHVVCDTWRFLPRGVLRDVVNNWSSSAWAFLVTTLATALLCCSSRARAGRAASKEGHHLVLFFLQDWAGGSLSPSARPPYSHLELLRCVGVICFLFNVLQLLPLGFTHQKKRNSCCFTKSRMKHLQNPD